MYMFIIIIIDGWTPRDAADALCSKRDVPCVVRDVCT